MINLPIAIQLYSLRKEMSENFEQTLKACSEMGFNGVEFADTYNKSANEIKTLCDKYSLIPVSAHVPFEKLSDENVVKEYAMMGCKYIAVPWIGSEYRPGGEKHEAFIDGMKKAGELCRKYSMTLLYHNHWFEFENDGDEHFLDYLYRVVPEGYLSSELDSCWVNIGGENPADYVLKYSNRAPVVHLKDFTGNMKDAKNTSHAAKTNTVEGEFEFKPLGQGLQDIRSIISSAEKAKSEWLVYEMDSPCYGKTPLQCAKESIDYLKTL